MSITRCIALGSVFCWLLLGSACSSEEPEPEPQGEQEPAATDEERCGSVAIVMYGNPLVWPEGEEAENKLGAALDHAGIKWGAAGSANWSIDVAVRDEERAREIVKQVLASHDLQAWVVE